MTRIARVYVTSDHHATPGIKALLDNNRIQYVEVDVTNDASARERILQSAGRREWPIIELDGAVAAGTNILNVARRLALKLTCGPPSQGACC